MLGGVSAVLSFPFYEDLVKNKQITKAEFDSTTERAKDLVETLKRVPANKLDALVATYDEQLTEHAAEFNAEWPSNYLAAFKDAEILLGFVTSILAKAGIDEA